jgi:hypothetical protein
MSPNVRFTLPVPSTALLGTGPILELKPRRSAALGFSYEAANDEVRNCAIVFEGIEAFRCTYFRARDAAMLEAYDKLVDRGETPWLNEVRTNLVSNGARSERLAHLMINFDDGPAYEFICTSFRLDEE